MPWQICRKSEGLPRARWRSQGEIPPRVRKFPRIHGRRPRGERRSGGNGDIQSGVPHTQRPLGRSGHTLCAFGLGHEWAGAASIASAFVTRASVRQRP